MGFFDKIKSAVGIGNPKIEFTLDSTQIKRGESIKGSLTLTGGSRESNVKMFVVEHIEILTRRKWSDTMKKMVDEKVMNTVNKIEIPKGDAAIQPGETMTETFELGVSTGAICSGHPYAHQLKISADVPGLDPSKKQDIYIL